MSFRSKSIPVCVLLIVYLAYTNFRMTDLPPSIPHQAFASISAKATEIRHIISTPASLSSITATLSPLLPAPTSSGLLSGIRTPLESPSLVSPNNDPDEKYLTFLTHSGFQNQLIQVENGILLAWYLNRTLILPRALLGQAFGWSYYPKLHLEHLLRDPGTTLDCEEYANEIDRYQIRCPDRDLYAMLPFDTLFDLSWAKQHVKIITREQVDDDWLATTLGIHGHHKTSLPTNGTYVDGDSVYYCGATRYDWRIYDTPRKSHRLGKYAQALSIYDLRQRKEKLMHFTSLFGSGRLPIRRPEHYDFLRSLQKSITYHHPAVLEMADLLVSLLGGHGNFIGIHVRSGDGWFVNALPETLTHIISQLATTTKRTQFLDLGVDEMTQPPTPPDLATCVAAAQKGKAMLIYMATDARDPRSHTAFAPLYTTYPCSFTLHDILGNNTDDYGFDYRENGSSPAMPWSILDKVRNPLTGASMRSLLVPLVDAAVASRGSLFLGSKGSTFSGYISRLHRAQSSSTRIHS